MRVLFYAGYQKERFDKLTYLDYGIGGSEYSLIKLSQQFANNGHEVYVSGFVYTEEIDGVYYVDTNDLQPNQHFDVVIAINYIHYVPLFDEMGITYDKSYFWMHNDEYYPYYNGEILPNNGMDYLQSRKVTKVVAVSNYHADIIRKKYESISYKVVSIDNAIDLSDFDSIGEIERISDKFIYTSAADRGLQTLLEMWPRIKEIKPKASLVVASPPYAMEWYDEYKGMYDDVEFVGNLSPFDLYSNIKSSEYWLYPSQYDETYCITALEMMYGGVKIISTDTGNLKHLLEGRAGIVPSDKPVGVITQSLIDTLEFLDERNDVQSEYLNNSKIYASNQNWEVRFDEWNTMINTTGTLHPELYSYYDNPDEWKKRFITYSALTKEWDLIVDEPFMNTFSFPLFTPEFCKMIREEAEYSNAWTINRHEFYPTTDMVLQTIGMHDIYMEVLREYVMPVSIHMWALEGDGWDDLQSENFLARYTPDAQGHLAIHHDSSDITCLVQLSDLDEYDGGGTWFRRQKELHKSPIGYVSIHPGNITHKHGARAVTQGARYIIVSFMKNPKR